jgi:hypothetical protein
MTQEDAPTLTLDDLLRRLDAAKQTLVEALNAAAAIPFQAETEDGDSLRRALERTVDDVNFYYGRLAARALNLPQPPCLSRADFGTLREGVMSLQVAHRRFTNLLHDLIPDDLEKVAADPELGTFTLRQVLEMTAAQYNMRTQQVQRLAAGSGTQ